MIYQNIASYCKRNNISISDFEKKCGIGNGVVGGWKNGKSTPNLKSLSKIANATGIPISEWLEKETL